jgi:hypothetical protein
MTITLWGVFSPWRAPFFMSRSFAFVLPFAGLIDISSPGLEKGSGGERHGEAGCGGHRG